MSRLSNIVFTWNNYDQGVLDLVESFAETCSYIVVGKEVGEECGTPHLQGYAEFKNARGFAAIKKMLPGAHIEKAQGDGVQNRDYCTKDGDVFIEAGTMKKQGKRNDLASMRAAVVQGKRVRAMVEDGDVSTFPALKAVPALLALFEPARNWEMEVIWITGSPGAGKSRMAYQMCEDPYTKDCHNKWWDGYDAHEDVIMDDFRDSQMSLVEFLRIIDRNHYRCEFKGGSRQLRAKRIIVTSIMKPEDCYKHAKGEPIKQLTRRITKVIDLDSDVFDREVGGNTTPQLPNEKYVNNYDDDPEGLWD